MIKRLCVHYKPQTEDAVLMDSLLDVVSILLNGTKSRQAIIDYPDAGCILIYVLTLDDGPLTDRVVSRIAFLLSCIQDDEVIDRWIDSFAEMRHEKYKFETIVNLLETTQQPDVAERLMFFINIAVKNHLTLFKRKGVRMID